MKQFEILLSSDYSEYSELKKFIMVHVEGLGYSNQFIDGLQLSIKEAFVNAIKHGNREQHDLAISCKVTLTKDLLQASIRDCGKGFNPYDQPNPAEPGNLLKLSGRGLYIIRSFVEKMCVTVDDDGSTLMLHYIPY